MAAVSAARAVAAHQRRRRSRVSPRPSARCGLITMSPRQAPRRPAVEEEQAGQPRERSSQEAVLPAARQRHQGQHEQQDEVEPVAGEGRSTRT